MMVKYHVSIHSNISYLMENGDVILNRHVKKISLKNFQIAILKNVFRIYFKKYFHDITHFSNSQETPCL